MEKLLPLLKNLFVKDRKSFTVALMLLLLFGISNKSQAQVYYMTNDATSASTSAGEGINRMDYDGNNATAIVGSFTVSPTLFEVDLANNRAFVYEAYSSSPPTGLAVKVINLTTGAVTATVPITGTGARCLALKYDPVNDYIYFLVSDISPTTATTNDALYKVKPDGTGLTTVISSFCKNPTYLALDIVNNKAYVYNQLLADKTFYTVSLTSGTVVQTGTIVAPTTGVFSVNDIGYDAETDYLYYLSSNSAATTNANDALSKVHPDGSGYTVVASVPQAATYTFMTLDAGNNRAFVSDNITPARNILSINLTTGGITTVKSLSTLPTATVVPALWVPYRAMMGSTTATSVSSGSATLGGSALKSAATVTERGVVYSSSNAMPTIGGTGVTKAANGTGLGTFSASITGLSVSTTYYVRAYATSTAGTSYSAVTTFSTLSNDATLSAFAISSGTLTPTFSAATTGYTASVATATTSITVTPTRNQANATITVNGTAVSSGSASGNISLNIGDNTITTIVTAQDGGTKTYTLSVNRPKAAQTITFNALSSKTYGDADYAPGATASSGFTVAYASSNTAVATIVSGQIHIVGAGTTNITASQAGDGTTLAAANVIQSLTVNKNAITVTATANQTKVYGNADPTFAYTVTSGTVKSGDTFTGALTRAAGSDVGSYAITIGTLALNTTNYTLTLTSNNFAITKRPLEITPTPQTKVYGDSEPASYTYTFTSGTSLASGDGMSGPFVRAAGETPGTYAFSIGTKHPVNTTTGADLSSNYAITFVSTNLTITKRPLTIAPLPVTKVYGTADFAGGAPYTFNGTSIAPGEAMTGSFGRDNSSENVGVYNLTLGLKRPVNASTGEDLSANYAITFVSNTFTITAKPITVNAFAQSKTYGDADPALTYNYTSLAFNDSFTGALSRTAGENSGTYAINKNTLALSSNYSLSFTGATLTIDKKVINVTADAKTKSYGDADPAFTYTTDGALPNGENFTGALARQTGELTGIYYIRQGTLALSSNYTLNFTQGVLTIDRKIINVTANAKTKTYGDSDPALTYTADALVGTDTFTGALYRTPGETAGTYTISQGTLSTSGGGYTLNFTGANLTIGKRAIIVTAYPPEVQYGNPDASISYSYSGTLVAGDAFTGALGRDAGTAIGSYPVNLGTLAITRGESYDITFNGGLYKIVPREIQVTGGTTIKTYGDADPAINYTIYSGTLLPGAQITGSVVRAPGETAGPYNVNQGTLAINDPNYKLTYLGGYFEIDRAPLTLTIDNKTKVATKPNPALTYSVSGFKNGDTEATAFSSAINLITDANINSAAGNYNIYPNGAVSALNYNLTTTGGILTVTAASSIKTLASATVNGGGFDDGAFDPATNFYSVSIPNGSTSATFVATVTDPLSSISIGYDPATATPLASGTPYTVTIANNSTEQLPVNVTAEDGTVNSYYFNINPIPSDSKLSNLVTDIGIIQPSFNPLVTSYNVDVPADAEFITITPTPHDPSATARVSGSGEGSAGGAKKVALSEGINPKNISVRSADGSSTTFYSLSIKRPIRLKTLTLSAGNLFPVFDPNITTYTARVNSAIPDVTITPKGNQDFFSLYVNGDYVNYGDASAPITINADGTTTATVKIVAGDGETSQTYTINFVHASSVATLASVDLSKGTLDPLFNSDADNYNIYLPNSTTALALTPHLTDVAASIKVNNATLAAGTTINADSLHVGLNPYYVKVTAADGTTEKTYTFNITRAYATESGLSDILLSQGTLSPAFNPTAGNSYSVALPNTTTAIQVTPVLADNTATLQAKVNGTDVPVTGGSFNASLNTGANNIIITGTAQDGTTLSIYNITVNRLQSSDALLSNLTVSNGTLSPAFNPAVGSYAVTVPTAVSSVSLTPTANSPGAIVKVNGQPVVSGSASADIPLLTGENTINTIVTSEDGNAVKTYAVKITRVLSDDGRLSLIKLSPTAQLSSTTGTANFNYTMSVPNELTSATLQLTAYEAAASIKIDGTLAGTGDVTKTISLAGNVTTVNIAVTAPNGTVVKTYALSIVKAGSSNAKLSLVKFDVAAALSTITGPANVNYSTSVPATLTQVTLQLTAEDAGAAIKIDGSDPGIGTASKLIALTGAATTVNVLVTAPNGVATKTYAITINRNGSSNAKLSWIRLSQASTLASFAGAANYNYNVNMATNTASATLLLTAEDADATIQINGTAAGTGTASRLINLTGPATMVHVLVTAPSGYTRTYDLNLVKPLSDDAKLSLIALNPTALLNTITGSANYNYSMSVPNATTTAILQLTADETAAVIKVDGTVAGTGSAAKTITLTGLNTIVNIVVVAPNGVATKTYAITIARAGSSNAKLSLIKFSVTAALSTVTGTANYNYATSVDNSLTQVTLQLTAEDADATIRVNGINAGTGTSSNLINLPTLATTINILVTAPNGTDTRTYAITVNRAGSSNAKLSWIRLNQAASLASFTGSANYNYNINMATGTPSTTLLLTAEDAGATIKIDGVAAGTGTASRAIALPAQATLVHVLVTAPNGVATRTYDLNIVKPALATLMVMENNNTDYIKDVNGKQPEQPVEVVVHQALSPNGDGINDKLNIDGIGAYPDNTVRIINRSGEVIFEAKGYDNNNNAFDGHAGNGTLQTAGTYFYALDYKKGDQTVHKTGYIVIKY